MAIDTTPTKPGTSVSAALVPSNSGSRPVGATSPGLANNFETFLSLLTAQLRNQNPLDPLNVNQFTQQLVQFAQVEQQLKGNSFLEALVNTQKTAQSTQALAFVGRTAVVDGSIATLTRGSAVWALHTPKSIRAVVTVTNSAGQTVHSETRTLAAGQNRFAWSGKDDTGGALPNGVYRLAVTAKDGGDRNVPISTEVEATVDSVDLTASPVLLSIGGQTYTMDKIKRVVLPSSHEPSSRL